MSLAEITSLQKRLERSSALLQIASIISSQQSLEAILNKTVEAINRHLGYEDVALLLNEEEKPGFLSLRARSGHYASHLSLPQRFPINEGIIGQAIKQAEALWVPDVQAHPAYIPIPNGESVQSELAIPIYFEKQLLGLLNIETEHLLADEDVADLKLIASHLAIALANAKRHEKERVRSERLELIARVGQRIAARLDQEELFLTTIEELQHLGYEYVALFLMDDDNPENLILKARKSLWPVPEHETRCQSINQGVIGLAAQQRQPVLVKDLKNKDVHLAYSGAPGMLSELSVPLLLQERLLGVMDLASAKVFGTEDLRAIQIIADQLAVAMDHAKLFADTKQRLVETDLLYQISRQISNALSLNEIALAYLELVAAQGKYNCTIVIYEFDENGERKYLNVLGRWRLAEGFIQEHELYPYFRDEFDSTLDQGQLVIMSNVLTDPRASKTLKKAQKDRPALAIIPLMVGSSRIGLITLNHPKPHDWPEADLRPYQVTAAQLATAIYSRQQQQRVMQQEQVLAALAERQRLARDLHDSVSQLIFSMTLIAQSILPAMERSKEEGESRILRLLELAQKSRAELRALLTELKPTEQLGQILSDSMLLRKDGLVATLKQHLRRLPESLKLEFLVSNYKTQALVIEEAMFRIAQEAVNNVLKHAQARALKVNLYADKMACYLSVKDDGLGFSSLSVKDDHYGLGTMRERAEALGGSLMISSSLGLGTEVQAKIPLQKKR